MNYEDFPILKNSEYLYLNEQYLKTNPSNRESFIKQICNEIAVTLNSFLSIEYLYNDKINKAIKTSYQTLSKHLNNLSSLFNIKTSPIQSISNTNIFTFIRKINNIICLTFDWLIGEEKEYHKTLGNKNINELINCLNEIISSMENSKINFYKYM